MKYFKPTVSKNMIETFTLHNKIKNYHSALKRKRDIFSEMRGGCTKGLNDINTLNKLMYG
jgi:hypothetical protein